MFKLYEDLTELQTKQGYNMYSISVKRKMGTARKGLTKTI